MDKPLQAVHWLLSGGAGFILGAYYDIFRLARLIFKPGKTAVFLQDLLFFITAAFMTYLFFLAVADGAVRWVLLVWILVGFFAWRATVGRVVYGIAKWLIAFITKGWRLICRILTTMERYFQKIAQKPVLFIKKRLHSATKVLYNHIKSRKLLSCHRKKEASRKQ